MSHEGIAFERLFGLLGGAVFVAFLAGTRLSRTILQPIAACSVGWIELVYIHYTINGMFSDSTYANVGSWAFGVAVITVADRRPIRWRIRKCFASRSTGPCSDGEVVE